jgi:uncharacterized membrane protein YeaQ/YmgE (transglycosylase-associated protein family)
MDILTWLIVGLIAGVLAGLLVGGVGLIGDIVVGIVGAFVGGWLFSQLGINTPFSGLAGTIFTAFIGGGTALLFGAGVGAGVSAGSKDARHRRIGA